MRAGQHITRRQTPDEAAVERLVRGEPVKAQMIDYWEAIRRLHRREYSDGQMAYVLRRPRRSIMRTRIALGLPPVIPRHGPAAPLHPYPTRPRSLR